jgi:hypothetical protein
VPACRDGDSSSLKGACALGMTSGTGQALPGQEGAEGDSSLRSVEWQERSVMLLMNIMVMKLQTGIQAFKLDTSVQA